MRSVKFPGAVVVALGPRFVCFYHGWGDVHDNNIITPMLTTELVCPAVCADVKYRVCFVCSCSLVSGYTFIDAHARSCSVCLSFCFSLSCSQ